MIVAIAMSILIFDMNTYGETSAVPIDIPPKLIMFFSDNYRTTN